MDVWKLMECVPLGRAGEVLSKRFGKRSTIILAVDHILDYLKEYVPVSEYLCIHEDKVEIIFNINAKDKAKECVKECIERKREAYELCREREAFFCPEEFDETLTRLQCREECFEEYVGRVNYTIYDIHNAVDRALTKFCILEYSETFSWKTNYELTIKYTIHAKDIEEWKGEICFYEIRPKTR